MRRLMEMAEHKPRRLSRLIARFWFVLPLLKGEVDSRSEDGEVTATGKRMPRGERKKFNRVDLYQLGFLL